MPMNRALYPDNWDDIARQIKEQAHWTCDCCGRPWRPTGQSWAEFVAEKLLGHSYWYFQSYDDIHDPVTGNIISVDRPQRFTLTVAHLNHQPEDCRPENLRALCAPCHCRYDLQPASMSIKRRLKAERNGQMSLDLGI